MIDRPSTVSLNRIMNVLMCGVMVLLVSTSVARAQLVQTTDSEAQLASVLCRNPRLDNQDPLNSYLLLTKTDDETENDGLLRARETTEMHLDADLAVLSACETGNGRISPGEGVIGMSWAFFVAGARSVVVSQWKVNSAKYVAVDEAFLPRAGQTERYE